MCSMVSPVLFDALFASGNVPMIMNAVHDPGGAPAALPGSFELFCIELQSFGRLHVAEQKQDLRSTRIEWVLVKERLPQSAGGLVVHLGPLHFGHCVFSVDDDSLDVAPVWIGRMPGQELTPRFDRLTELLLRGRRLAQ